MLRSLGLLASLLAPPGGTSGDLSLELRYRAPAPCPDRAALRRSVSARLGAQASARALAATVDIAAIDARRWRLTLEIRDGEHVGARELEAPSCVEAVETAAWLIALTLDPGAPAAAPDVADTESLVPPPPPANGTAAAGAGAGASAPNTVAPTPAGRRQLTPARARRAGEDLSQETSSSPRRASARRGPREPEPDLRYLLTPAGGVAVGPAAGVTAALDLEFGLERRYGRFEIAFTYVFPVTVQDLADSEVRGRFDLYSANVRGCGVPRVASVQFPLCAGLLVGGMRGRGEGEITPQTALSAWIAATASVSVEWWLHERVALRVVARGLASLTKPQFHVLNPDQRPILSASPAAFWGLGGLTVRVF